MRIPCAHTKSDCFRYRKSQAHWWTYEWCYGKSASQLHWSHEDDGVGDTIYLGDYVHDSGSDKKASPFVQRFQHSRKECVPEGMGQDDAVARSAVVHIRCCDAKGTGAAARRRGRGSRALAEMDHTIIDSVNEPSPCQYRIEVCSSLVCGGRVPDSSGDEAVDDDAEQQEQQQQKQQQQQQHASATAQLVLPSHDEQESAKSQVKSMFYHAYDAYMTHAFPAAELRPLSCTGGKFDLIKIPMVTLIDSLDTLVILGNHTEFRRAVALVSDQLPNFDLNTPISVFETTIR